MSAGRAAARRECVDEEEPAPNPGMVRCLGARCSKTFLSRDKATNRICPACAKKLKDYSPPRIRSLGGDDVQVPLSASDEAS